MVKGLFPGGLRTLFSCLFAALLLAPLFEARAEVYATDWYGREDQTQVRLISAVGGVGDLAEIRLGVEFRMQPGWKIYWRTPGPTGYPPAVDWSESTNLVGAELFWPAPHRFTIFGIEAIGYGDGGVVLPVVVRPERPGEPLGLRAKVDYLTCKEVCVPDGATLTLDIPAGPASATPMVAPIDRYRARVPVSSSTLGLTIGQPELRPGKDTVTIRFTVRSGQPIGGLEPFVEGPADSFFQSPEVAFSGDGRTAIVTMEGIGRTPEELAAAPLLATLVDGDRAGEEIVQGVLVDAFSPLSLGSLGADRSLWLILGLAVLGGLILNLMPCVLPVLSLKLLSVLGHGGRENTGVRLGFLASVAGIITSFMLLAAVLAALKAAGASIGWGIQFQQPVFLAVMVVVVTLFACNLFGLFEIVLPAGLSNLIAFDSGPRHEHHHSLGGHFLTGAFATLLATPCSAPYLGTAVGFAFSRGTTEIFMVFGALGLGLSAPYLLVAAFPGMATRLPRPGKWMVTLKRILGLLLVATALWLVTVISVEAGTATATGIALAAATIGIVLAVRRLEGSRLGRHGGKVAAILAAAIVAAPLFAPQGSADAPPKLDDAIWQPFDQAEIRRLVADGQTVLVDVTADWCITCQVNKAAVLNRDPVATLLERGAVVAMRADWTSPSQEIADYLASFGRYGIPFNAVYGPDAPGGVMLPEILVSDRILAAVEKAGGAGALALQ